MTAHFEQHDFQQIPILGLVAESSGSAPASPVNGQLWYDSGAGKLKAYQGGWVILDQDTTYLTGSLALINAGSEVIGKLWTAKDIKDGILANAPVLSVAGKTGTVTLVKADVGLSNVPNTDMTNVSNAASGTLAVARGGTGSGTAPTPGGVMFGQSATVVASTAAGSAGQILISAGAGTPTWATPDQGALPDSWLKNEVKATTLANVSLPPGGTTLTLDGVSLANNDRVLLKKQTALAENGIYIVSGVGTSVVLTRSTDTNTAARMAGAVVKVDLGTKHGGELWSTNFKSSDTLGTTACKWGKFLNTNYGDGEEFLLKYGTSGYGFQIADHNNAPIFAVPLAGGPKVFGDFMGAWNSVFDHAISFTPWGSLKYGNNPYGTEKQIWFCYNTPLDNLTNYNTDTYLESMAIYTPWPRVNDIAISMINSVTMWRCTVAGDAGTPNGTWVPITSNSSLKSIINFGTTGTLPVYAEYVNAYNTTTITLQNPNVLKHGQLITIKNSGFNTVTIAAHSGSIIDGASSFVLAPNQMITLMAATTVWFVSDSYLPGKYELTLAAGTTGQYYRGDKTWQTLDKTAVGLPNVDNTSDANKPVSTAQATAIGLKADKASPTFTGTVTIPTPTAGDNSTKAASTAFVQGEITTALNNAIQGLDAKVSVRAASTGNLTLSGAQTVDTVALIAGDRVLVKDQSTASANGIYVVAAGAWTRATDMNAWTKVPNAFVFVEEGSQADSGWVCSSNAGGTLNTTSITWVQFSQAGVILAGTGLTKSGNTISITPGGVGTTELANLGVTTDKIANNAVTLTTGAGQKVTGTLPVANGGTGATTAPAARTALGVQGTATLNVPALTSGAWTALPNSGSFVNSSVTVIPHIQFMLISSSQVCTLDVRLSGGVVQVKADKTVAVSTISATLSGSAAAGFTA